MALKCLNININLSLPVSLSGLSFILSLFPSLYRSIHLCLSHFVFFSFHLLLSYKSLLDSSLNNSSFHLHISCFHFLSTYLLIFLTNHFSFTCFSIFVYPLPFKSITHIYHLLGVNVFHPHPFLSLFLSLSLPTYLSITYSRPCLCLPDYLFRSHRRRMQMCFTTLFLGREVVKEGGREWERQDEEEEGE